jgi:hypothetical protein
MSSKKRKRLILGFLIIDLIIVIIYFSLPAETKNRILNSVSEGVENAENKPLKEFVSIQSLTSRKAVLGDDWIVKGKIFNMHDSLSVSSMKLMFNFSDGVETVMWHEEIPPKNSVARKFKERISGHGDAKFLSVDVLEAK